MTAIIIDDENKPRRVLEVILTNEYPEFTQIYQASNLLEGITIIKKEKPNIVFLDIEMPQYSGLDIMNMLGETIIQFQLVFVTAYDKYAIEAFKLSAIDYLLKPISIEDVKRSVDRAFKKLKEQQQNHSIEALKKVMKTVSINKIAVETPNGVKFASYDTIYYLKADGMYTKVYFDNKKYELICKPLRYFEEQLKDKLFFYRPHRSYLVNLKHLKELVNKNGLELLLDNNVSIPISKNKYQEFLKIIKEVF